MTGWVRFEGMPVAQVVTYAASFIVFAGLDFIWLGIVAHGFYRSQIGHLIADKFNLPAAAAFYLLYVLGVMIFVITPAASAGGVSRAFVQGVMFGLFCYGTYDLTNLATLKSWPLPLTLIDMAWGAFLTGIAAAAGTYVAGRF